MDILQDFDPHPQSDEYGTLIIPASFDDDHDIYISHYHNIKYIPQCITVRNAYLRQSRILHLPSGFRVKNHLDISETGIKELPFDLMVGQSVSFSVKTRLGSERWTREIKELSLREISDMITHN